MIVSLLLVTIVFANNFLDTRLAENEFSSSKQFMLTTGLQVDDVAWTIGRTQTVRYSSRYGSVAFEPSSLNYTFEVTPVSGPVVNYTIQTGIILYNVPTSMITYGNNYFERIFPSSSDSFLQNGSAAAVARVFAREKLPMSDGSYTRVVAVPSIRTLNSTVSGTTYVKFYLPSLTETGSEYLSQSITLTGNSVTKTTKSSVTQVRITLAFPSASRGFTEDFFNFASSTQLISFSGFDDVVVEIYVGNVAVSFGMYT